MTALMTELTDSTENDTFYGMQRKLDLSCSSDGCTIDFCSISKCYVSCSGGKGHEFLLGMIVGFMAKVSVSI